MDTDYLKTKEDLRFVRSALSIARSLEEAEKTLEESTVSFREASQNIVDKLGFELWHTDASGGEYFWRWGKRESIHYETRVAALKALLDEEIEWNT